MIRRGAVLFALAIASACGGTSFTAGVGDAGGDEAHHGLEVPDAVDEVLVDVPELDAGAGADALDELHQVDAAGGLDALDEVLVDGHTGPDVEAAVDALDEVLVDAGPCSHSDGVGQSFTACEPMDRTLAQEACAAYAAATPAAACSTVQLGCSGSGFGVCALSTGACTCWEYAGGAAGHVHTASACALRDLERSGWQ